MAFAKGFIPWNKGLTKDIDSRLNYERPTAFKRGHKSKYEGLAREGFIPWNKGMKIGDRCRKKTKYEKRNCLECEKAFNTYPSLNKKYCSLSCRSLATKNWKSQKGSKMTLEQRKILSIAHKGLNAGEKHHNWKGGISPLNKRERNRFRNELQTSIFERDRYTCIECGKTGILQVHHIKAWAEYPELRFDESNCKTLCKSCHYRVTFGREFVNADVSWGSNFIKIREDI